MKEDISFQSIISANNIIRRHNKTLLKDNTALFFIKYLLKFSLEKFKFSRAIVYQDLLFQEPKLTGVM